MTTTYLSVQHAARRLGVSPVTVRRWTASGFLPCTRTPGGHRRIAADDIDDLARSITSSTRATAQLAREREIDTLVDIAIALGSQLDLSALLAEIARQVTRLLDCQFCSVAEYDRDAGTVTALAEYDATGKRLPTPGTYTVAEFPLTRQVIREQTPRVVNVDDPGADAAEVAALRGEGDRSILIVPLVYRGETIGLIEAIDHARARKYTRQELRLCGAVAGQAGVALRNARLFASSRASGTGAQRLTRSLALLAAHVGELSATRSRHEFARCLAEGVCQSLDAVSCVVSGLGVSTGAARGATSGEPPDLVISTAATTLGDLTITVALDHTAAPGQAELLDLVTNAAAVTVAHLDD